jgi:hypothetical protein
MKLTWRHMQVWQISISLSYISLTDMGYSGLVIWVVAPLLKNSAISVSINFRMSEQKARRTTYTRQGSGSQTVAAITAWATARLLEGWRADWQTPDAWLVVARYDSTSSADRTNRFEVETRHSLILLTLTPTQWLPEWPQIYRDICQCRRNSVKITT